MEYVSVSFSALIQPSMLCINQLTYTGRLLTPSHSICQSDTTLADFGRGHTFHGHLQVVAIRHASATLKYDQRDDIVELRRGISNM